LKNCLAVAGVDVVLLACGVLGVPLVSAFWSSLTEYLPNFYEPFVLEFIAFLTDNSPSSVASAGDVVSLLTLFFTLLTVHLLVAFGIGKLFSKLSPNVGWSAVNYAVLAVILLAIHLFLVGRAYLFYS
jgi:hypothetical protein